MRGWLQFFPYEPREGQGELADFVFSNIRRGKNVCVEAPTGFGKTPVILAALMPLVYRGAKVVWTVRTGNETDRPIEELKVMCDELGVEVFAFSFRGKRDMCLLARDLGLAGLGYREASYICRRKRGECPYYRGLSSSRSCLEYLLGEPRTYTEILETCRDEEVCPYFLQRTLLKYADVVSLSYNYIVNERVSWTIRRVFPFRRAILVVDEAHNLQHVNLFSDSISETTFRNAVKEADEYDFTEFLEPLTAATKKVDELKSMLQDGGLEDSVYDPYQLASDLTGYLSDMAKCGERIRAERLESGKPPRSSLGRLAEFWLGTLDKIGVNGIAFIASLNSGRLVLESWDMRSAEVLRGCWGMFRACVFCSGTLRPVKAFAEVVGLDNYVERVVSSSYGEDQVQVLITRGLTTRGESVSEAMASMYVDAITCIARLLKANMAVFTASYRVMDALLKADLASKLEEAGRKVFIERRGMSGDEARGMLIGFKSAAYEAGKGVLLATMGGRFAEGADFPGKELEVVFLVGIPFDRPTARSREYLKYYIGLYGEERGLFYGYIIPAIRRAAQAMGRAIRSSEDRAVVICGDERYSKYLGLLPDYAANAKLVSPLELIKYIKRGPLGDRFGN